MITLERPADHVVHIGLSGLLTKEDVERVGDGLRAALATGRPLGVLVDMTGMEDMTEDAVAADLRMEASLLPQVGRFRRLALVSDLRFVRALVDLASRLLPMVEARVFPAAEAEAARAFAAEAGRGPEGVEGGVRILEEAPGFMAFEIDGAVSGDAARPVLERIEAAGSEGRRIDLLARITRLGGFDPAMLMDPAFMGGKLDAIRAVRRYAIVGAPGWMAWIATTAGAAMPMAIRAFDEESAARDWLATA